MTALSILLDTFRSAGKTERERGTYFEELIVAYLRTEPLYKELYATVETYTAWASRRGIDGRDAGIDLVAETVAGDVHAIQCKLYAADHRVQKSDIDSFFTASGKRPFTHRVIVATTSAPWGELAEDALRDQQPEVNKIDLAALESSVIDWSRFAPRQEAVVRPKKALRPHQVEAVEAVERGLADGERGKLIMACGTGKTFTSLRIAERLAGRGKRVLFLVPSLSLLSQTLTEWTQESAVRLRSFAVCSDSDVGKKRRKDDDVVQTFAHELQFPATTRADRLATEVLREHDGEHMSVVFATYHSIDVIHRAQHAHDLPPFDLIVCDEAHRTTGSKFADEDESAFTRIHDGDYVRGAKRLYMTATPRIYAPTALGATEPRCQAHHRSVRALTPRSLPNTVADLPEARHARTNSRHCSTVLAAAATLASKLRRTIGDRGRAQDGMAGRLHCSADRVAALRSLERGFTRAPVRSREGWDHPGGQVGQVSGAYSSTRRAATTGTRHRQSRPASI